MIESAETDKENTITETNQKPVSGKNAVGTQFLQKFKHNQGRVILRSFEGKSWEGFITAYDEYSIIISNKT
jgi:sRNA-binding regulator protein Hfq